MTYLTTYKDKNMHRLDLKEALVTLQDTLDAMSDMTSNTVFASQDMKRGYSIDYLRSNITSTLSGLEENEREVPKVDEYLTARSPGEEVASLRATLKAVQVIASEFDSTGWNPDSPSVAAVVYIKRMTKDHT
jgi:hypothetical protein